VLQLLSRGAMYKEIGDQLGISLGTVRSHIAKIYEKLHVHSRAEAMLKVFGKDR
jgi:DNA-binding NarL/FixJ family response regulator